MCELATFSKYLSLRYPKAEVSCKAEMIRTLHVKQSKPVNPKKLKNPISLSRRSIVFLNLVTKSTLLSAIYVVIFGLSTRTTITKFITTSIRATLSAQVKNTRKKAQTFNESDKMQFSKYRRYSVLELACEGCWLCILVVEEIAVLGKIFFKIRPSL